MLDHTPHVSQGIAELKREIEGIQELTRIYHSQKHHRRQEQVAHERRRGRLEEIVRQLDALRAK